MVAKWTQNPRRVAGTCHAVRAFLATARSFAGSWVRGAAPVGVSRRRNVTTAYTDVARPVTRNVVVQPTWSSTRVRGTVATRLPRPPRAAVKDTTREYWRAVKWAEARRSRLMNVRASPKPRTARATRPS